MKLAKVAQIVPVPKSKMKTILMKIVGLVIVYAITTLLTKFLSGESLLSARDSVVIQDASEGPLLTDIGGQHEAKSEIWFSMIVPLRNSSLFFDGPRSLKCNRGILLVGPPGTGKTMLVRAAARASNAAFITPTLAQLEQKYYGETSKQLQLCFTAAVKHAPSILFFDEIDGLCRTRQAEEGCSYGLKTELLRQIDSLPHAAPVLIVGCTNYPKALDPALKRRLSTIITVALPSEKEREEILKICIRDENAPNQVDILELAQKTEGFSGSDLHSAYTAASKRRLRRIIGKKSSNLESLLTNLTGLEDSDWQHGITSVAQGKISADQQHLNEGREDKVSALRALLERITTEPSKTC